MATDHVLSSLLTQLHSIAQAPMTADERALRAKPLVSGDAVVEEIAAATGRGDLDWSKKQANEHGVEIETWLLAVHVVDLPQSDSLAELIDRLHKADAAADLLKAGYKSSRGPSGRIIWSGRG